MSSARSKTPRRHEQPLLLSPSSPSSSSRSCQGPREDCSGFGSAALLTVGAGLVGGLIGWYLHESSSPSRSRCRNSSGGQLNRTPSRGPPHRVEEDEPPNSPVTPKQCVICLKSFDFIRSRGGEVHTTPCGHLFCHYCIYQSLSVNRECPVCRMPVGRDETLQVFI